MIDGGEDPLFIARRLVILASEDVGLADSNGLQVAVAAQQAVHFVGMPEGFFPLAHATLYLATAPKSNSVGTSLCARRWRTCARRATIPFRCTCATRRPALMRELGYGKGYHYAHDDYDVKQLNLPENRRASGRYYAPGQKKAVRVILGPPVSRCYFSECALELRTNQIIERIL